MGQEVRADGVGREQRRAHRERLQACLGALEAMLADHATSPSSSVFENEEPRTGMEVELALVDGAGRPHPRNGEVLQQVADPDYQPEIGAHTIELNLPPGSLAGRGLARVEEGLRASLNAADARARAVGARLLMTGVLPSLLPEHLDGEWMTTSARYRALDEAVLSARGEDVELDITGPGPGGERLGLQLGSVAAESACTSTQLHLKVAPEDFAATWNAAQLIMGAQVALGANSPFGLGRRLWAETRVELFTQSIDTRPPELVAQGVRPRTFAGEDWATSVADLYRQNVAWFPALLPQVFDEDPVAELEAGRAPALTELCLHSGTVWRWNRPVYDLSGHLPDGSAGAPSGKAHLRVENRVLPAGPTVVDTVANAALYYGVVRVLVEDGPDPSVLLPHAAAVASFTDCARRGLDADAVWPGLGTVGVRRLLLEHLLPMAADGLARWGVDGDLVDRYLGVAQERASTGRTGAVWQVEAVAALEARGADRVSALQAMVGHYAQGMHANAPVHTWPSL